MLQLKEIRKAYGKNVVLEGINLSLANGIYGFLGANGVGKTTLFKIISGYIADYTCLLYTSPSPRDPKTSRMPSSA